MTSPLTTDFLRYIQISRLRTALLACAVIIPLTQSACNTTKGVGKDVEAAGEGLQEVADDTKDAIKN